MGTLFLSWHKMNEPVDIFDTNYNYYEQPKPEKKSKGGRLRALRRMTQNAAKIATDMTRLVTGGDLIQKAIQNRHEYDDTPFVPDASGGGGGDQKKQNYTKPRIDDFVYEVDGIANTLGQIVAPPAAGMMKTLISKGQNALEQSDGTFSTFTFKGWKIKTEAVFRSSQTGTYHLLAITSDNLWVLMASMNETFTMDLTNEITSEGITFQLDKLHALTQIQWAEPKTLTIDGQASAFTLMTTGVDWSEHCGQHWQQQAEGMSTIKREIISNNFDERREKGISVYTSTWIDDNRVKETQKESSSEEEDDEESEFYEYVMEELPQETAVFGSSRPLELDDAEPQQQQERNSMQSDADHSDEYQ